MNPLSTSHRWAHLHKETLVTGQCAYYKLKTVTWQRNSDGIASNKYKYLTLSTVQVSFFNEEKSELKFEKWTVHSVKLVDFQICIRNGDFALGFQIYVMNCLQDFPFRPWTPKPKMTLYTRSTSPTCSSLSIILLLTTWSIVPKLSCILQSPGKLLTLLMPLAYPTPTESEYLRVVTRHLFCLMIIRWLECALKLRKHWLWSMI